MATAEVDFRGALAYQVGELDRGFQHMMEFVVNISRLYNAVGSAGAARRAYVIAWTYAQHRRAFGAPIGDFPLTQDALAEMRAETMALVSGSLYLAHLRDTIETGEADEATSRVFRFAVNLNKYRTSVAGTDVVRRAIETLGGNGAMENFSVLPRLLRDSIIFEAWEGAHNTLLVQSLRDARRYRLHIPFFERLAEIFGGLRAGGWREAGLAKCQELRAEVEQVAEFDEQRGGVFFRPLADRLMYLFYLALLAREAEWEEAQSRPTGKRAVVDYLWQRRLSGRKASMTEYLARIAEISATI
jgi:hypothetical protein